MERKVTQEFIGLIKGVKVNNDSIYYATVFLLNQLENKFPKVEITESFIQQFAATLDDLYFNNRQFDLSTFEMEFKLAIDLAEDLTAIKLHYLEEEDGIIKLNQLLQDQQLIFEKNTMELEM